MLNGRSIMFCSLSLFIWHNKLYTSSVFFWLKLKSSIQPPPPQEKKEKKLNRNSIWLRKKTLNFSCLKRKHFSCMYYWCWVISEFVSEGTSGSVPSQCLVKAGSGKESAQVAQGLIKSGTEKLQGWRMPQLLPWPVLLLLCPWENAFPYVQSEPLLFLLSACFLCVHKGEYIVSPLSSAGN